MLPNISRSNGNQTKKFGQLIEYTWAIFFFKNHTQNVVTSPRIFYEKPKFNIHLDQQSEMSWSFFVVLQGWGLPNCIKSKVLITCSGLI